MREWSPPSRGHGVWEITSNDTADGTMSGSQKSPGLVLQVHVSQAGLASQAEEPLELRLRCRFLVPIPHLLNPNCGWGKRIGP